MLYLARRGRVHACPSVADVTISNLEKGHIEVHANREVECHLKSIQATHLRHLTVHGHARTHTRLITLISFKALGENAMSEHYCSLTQSRSIPPDH